MTRTAVPVTETLSAPESKPVARYPARGPLLIDRFREGEIDIERGDVLREIAFLLGDVPNAIMPPRRANPTRCGSLARRMATNAAPSNDRRG